MARTKKPFGEQNERMQALSAVAGTFKDFKPSREVLQRLQAVPTIFPQYDVATRVAGHPISRFTLVHGPSNHGKTTFTLGLGLSFLKRGHFFALADAERTTPPEWLESLMGSYLDHPACVALPVSTYEHCVDGVQDFCEKVGNARAKGQIPDDTTGIVVVDSIRKLTPKKLMQELMKGADSEAKGAGGKSKNRGVDGMGGRAAQIKAALNAAWMDSLIPLLADTKMAMAVIARETEDPNAGMFDEGIIVGGGRALFYDSSLALRITHSYLKHPDEAMKGMIVGEKHQVQVRKTKVGKKEERMPTANFYTSNGVLSPEGFDMPRDLLELGQDCGIIDLKGSWYSYDGTRLGQGEPAALQKLHKDADLLAAIEKDVRLATTKREAVAE